MGQVASRSCGAASVEAAIPSVELLRSTLDVAECRVPVQNIWCIGRNYVEHAKELNNPVPDQEPVIFLKSSSAMSPCLAFANEVFHHEIELVVMVGQHTPLGSLTVGKEYSCVRGFGLGLDLTRRGKQSELKQKGLPWALAKSFGGAAAVTPLVPLTESCKLEEQAFELQVNGQVKQIGHVKDMIFNIPAQLRHINSFVPLLPGDLLFTGTPQGVGPLQEGDVTRLRFLSSPLLANLDFTATLSRSGMTFVKT